MNIDALAHMMLGGAAMLTAQAGWRYLSACRAAKVVAEETPQEAFPTDLGSSGCRERLTRFFKAQGITGDANIRQGVVVETIQPNDIQDRLDEVRRAASTLLGHVSRGKMQGKDLFYAVKVENPIPGYPTVQYRLADINLDQIASLVVMGERVAEDRRRSRSLYKGLTDDQLTTIGRTALAQVFPQCKEGIRLGESDDTDHMKVAKVAVEILFQTKGASA